MSSVDNVTLTRLLLDAGGDFSVLIDGRRCTIEQEPGRLKVTFHRRDD